MNAAKSGFVAEFVTGYLQREIRKEVSVAGGTDTGLRDNFSLGIAVGRLVNITDDVMTPATGVSATSIGNATHIVAQSDDTIRDLPEDYNYMENYSSLPNLIVKNSSEKKTVAVFKIVNADDIKIIKIAPVKLLIAGTYDSSSQEFTDVTTYQIINADKQSVRVIGTLPYAEQDSVLGLDAGNRITIKFTNDEVTSNTDLPEGDIAVLQAASGEHKKTKDAFETDGSLIAVVNSPEGNNEVRISIEWTEGVVTEYIIDLSQVQRAEE